MNIRNKVQLVGHVGQNPDIRTYGDSGKLARFSVATNESYKNKNGEKVENTMWHNIVAWRKTADLTERLLQKGTFVLLEGRLIQRSYTDKDNVKKYTTEVEMTSFLVLSKKDDNAQPIMANSTKDFYKASAKDDDLPF